MCMDIQSISECVYHVIRMCSACHQNVFFMSSECVSHVRKRSHVRDELPDEHVDVYGHGSVIDVENGHVVKTCSKDM